LSQNALSAKHYPKHQNPSNTKFMSNATGKYPVVIKSRLNSVAVLSQRVSQSGF